eukprot:Blabericola_migrator_1__7383@NODE_3759_length_1531_cov_19_281421_g2336_i0_p1_GENE_NODE_3759_length_1531_cov_19_281421_g2336_i0NODE_3759_length_1531_cov_19_281421_g2336_i0_p1_ORF_typecomplete_len107_score11_89_NODE_3759_length_1531_cov_19_281421_g2336_i08621182
MSFDTLKSSLQSLPLWSASLNVGCRLMATLFLLSSETPNADCESQNSCQLSRSLHSSHCFTDMRLSSLGCSGVVKMYVVHVDFVPESECGVSKESYERCQLAKPIF